MTPVQWLYDQIGDTAPYEYAAQIASYLEEAMKMEKEIPELSDDEIKEWIDSTPYYGHCTPEYKEGLEDGIKWYKEQLKQRQ